MAWRAFVLTLTCRLTMDTHGSMENDSTIVGNALPAHAPRLQLSQTGRTG